MRRYLIDGEPALTRRQAALLLGVCGGTVAAWAEAGLIPAYAVTRADDGRWLYLESVIRELRDAEGDS